MKDPLVRFGVAIERSLLRDLDAEARKRRCTRSELLRDLARAEVGRAKAAAGVEAVATLTLVYDHHVRDLSEKLTELQHGLGEDVRAAMHVHLSRDLCLEVVVMRGRSDRLAALADQILAIRGVKHGGIEIIPAGAAGGDHDHARDHGHAHPHRHPHPHR
jgi:CopG family nickel-responsive transcriptional regulator